MNNYERAVIEAARIWKSTTPDSGGAWALDMLHKAVAALELHEQQQAAAGTSEIDWSLVVAGDEIRGKSGAFFPVIRTRRDLDHRGFTGRYVIEIGLPGGPKSIVRPIESEPFATVRRGPDGRAVDEFVNVFSSGEK